MPCPMLHRRAFRRRLARQPHRSGSRHVGGLLRSLWEQIARRTPSASAMDIKAKILATASAAVLLGGISLAKAADTKTKEPGDQALTSINKNLQKDSDNRGLLTAKQRIERNQARQEARETADRDDMLRPDRPARLDRPGR